MKALVDPDHVLAAGLGAIRTQFQLPPAFPPKVLAAAELAAKRPPVEHVDRTDWHFVTLDPATSTDLDQAFALEASGKDFLLHYAIADVAWFVRDGEVIDVEAWTRGTSQYLPDGKTSLYPPVLAEGAASLLPGGPRPAVIFTVRVNPEGGVRLDSAERAIIQSRAKLAYDSAQPSDLPDGFAEFAGRITHAEEARGAARVDPPEQEVAEAGEGAFTLQFRPRLVSEDRNAALSLSCNLAIADVLQAHHTGLFRVMAEPDANAVARLRLTANAFGLGWPSEQSLSDFRRVLDAHEPKQAAFMLAIRRAGERASYQPYQEGVTPWHAAMAATYAHATAPLRRLADRYVVQATLAIMNGKPVPDAVMAAFPKLPKVMAHADALGGQIDRAVIDLAETVMLKGQEGQIFDALVTDGDERGTRVQLKDFPIMARIGPSQSAPGDTLRLKLTRVDPVQRNIAFEIVG
jgi:exoribonuclease R